MIATPNGAIRVLQVGDSERLWVMQARSLHQLRRVAGTWAPVVDISLENVFHPAKKTDVKPEDTCNDIAVHDPARGASGSLYLALQGDLSAADSDQLWWFDGTSTWVKTGLRTKTTASVLAVVVEPGHLDTVYVGTTIGVFRTTVTFAGATPTFAPWTRLDNGLPDVAVQDLSVHSAGPVRLLRAGTQARGVWELDLTGPVADRTFLRVHPYDSRRTSPTPLAAPFEKLGARPGRRDQEDPGQLLVARQPGPAGAPQAGRDGRAGVDVHAGQAVGDARRPARLLEALAVPGRAAQGRPPQRAHRALGRRSSTPCCAPTGRRSSAGRP